MIWGSSSVRKATTAGAEEIFAASTLIHKEGLNKTLTNVTQSCNDI